MWQCVLQRFYPAEYVSISRLPSATVLNRLAAGVYYEGKVEEEEVGLYDSYVNPS